MPILVRRALAEVCTVPVLVFCDNICGIVSRGYMNLVQCIVSRHFMCDKKLSCSFVPPPHQILATPL